MITLIAALVICLGTIGYVLWPIVRKRPRAGR